MGHLYILLTILFTVYGQLVFKHEANTITELPAGAALIPFYVKFVLTRPLVISGFVSGILASVAWLGAVSKFELSYAYPFMSLNFVLVVLVSFLAFGEAVTLQKTVGLLVICCGVLIVGKSL